MSTSFEDLLKTTITETIEAMLPKLAPRIESVPDVMTRKQVAEYAQVSEWTVRMATQREDSPLPVAAFGDARYFKSDVERWMREEAARKLAGQSKAA